MKVRTTTQDTIVTGDGYVSRTTTTITTFSETDASDTHIDTHDTHISDTDASDGMAAGTGANDGTGVTAGAAVADASGCFDAAGCDEAERRLIAALRAYLRPTCAPAPLMARLHACLDRAEDEECRGCGK